MQLTDYTKALHGSIKIELASAFSKWKHRNQVRKYTGLPYYYHCQEVAHLVTDLELPDSTDMICAAYLHDTVEDTETTLEEIELLFGEKVRQYVYELTDISKPEDGNRATRKALDRQHIWNASREAQIIKLADLISNTRSISLHDKDFAVVYLKEKRLLLEGLDKTLPLYKQAYVWAHGGLSE